MNKDQSKIIIATGICLFLIIMTWTIMQWPIAITELEFWIFIFISFLEVVLVIIGSEIIKRKFKKRKKKDAKKLQKMTNITLIVSVVMLTLFSLAISGIVLIFHEINRYSEVYPMETMTYKLEDYEKELIIPSYSVVDGEYWDELVVFGSPKSYNQLEEELAEIFNTVPFEKIETDNGVFYYNQESDYTVTNYEIHNGLYMRTFNISYCDGYCANE